MHLGRDAADPLVAARRRSLARRAQRRHALIHELAHIRRHDYLSALIARICRAIHWYNPLVWFAAAQVTQLQEQACDDAVLRDGGGRRNTRSFW